MRQFVFLLARTLHRTVAELEATLSGFEFEEWVREYRREPWGDFRIDLAGAKIASIVAETHRDREKKAEPFTPLDFMPFLAKPKPSLEQKIRAAFQGLPRK